MSCTASFIDGKARGGAPGGAQAVVPVPSSRRPLALLRLLP
jgi:hypothetical protein